MDFVPAVDIFLSIAAIKKQSENIEATGKKNEREKMRESQSLRQRELFLSQMLKHFSRCYQNSQEENVKIERANTTAFSSLRKLAWFESVTTRTCSWYRLKVALIFKIVFFKKTDKMINCDKKKENWKMVLSLSRSSLSLKWFKKKWICNKNRIFEK